MLVVFDWLELLLEVVGLVELVLVVGAEVEPLLLVVEPVEVVLPVEVDPVVLEPVPLVVELEPVEVEPPAGGEVVTVGVASVKLPPVVTPFQILVLGLVLGVAIIEPLAKLTVVEPEPTRALKLTLPTNSLSVGAAVPPGT